MHGDFSKWFNERAYALNNPHAVLQQQGKVLLDSDWNDQARIIGSWQDGAGKDIIGKGVAAVSTDDPKGFKIQSAVSDGKSVTLTISPGKVWADGLPIYLKADTDQTLKANYLRPPLQDPAFDPGTIVAGAKIKDAVVLEVWRESINGFQVPELLIEPALGAPDTTERVSTGLALRLLRLETDDNCRNISRKLVGDQSKKGKLTVSLQPTIVIDGDCPVVEGGGYTGFEHNLYRIEIAQTDDTNALPMFKWSQFGGGLVGRGQFDANSKTVKITANMAAIIHSGLDNFYLEVVEYDSQLCKSTVKLGVTASLTAENELDIGKKDPILGTIPSTSGSDTLFFRLWNDIQKVKDFSITPAKMLNEGILLQFDSPDATHQYVPGDYWTFQVRAGGIDNSPTLINAKPPDGIQFHRVPLAILDWSISQTLDLSNRGIEDCRSIFRPLTEQGTCFTYTVGDGKVSHGDFDSLEEALANLDSSGGQILVLPGTHEVNAVIESRHDIRIAGCGDRTQIKGHQALSIESFEAFPIGPVRAKMARTAGVLPSIAALGRIPTPRAFGLQRPIFTIRNSTNISIELLNIDADAAEAFVAEETKLTTMQGIEISNNRILSGKHAILIKQGQGITIHDNIVQMKDLAGAGVAVYIAAKDSAIERNLISAPASNGVLNHALSGIQIAGGSERIAIMDNQVAGGSGNGITLGSSPELSAGTILETKLLAFIYRILIGRNSITNMGLSGIGISKIPVSAAGTAASAIPSSSVGNTVIDLTISQNQISSCLQTPFDSEMLSQATKWGGALGGISLGICENLSIQGNRIENNGLRHVDPVCGIYVLFGQQVDISDNRIINNGPLIIGAAAGLEPGLRGGIVMLVAAFSDLGLSVASPNLSSQGGRSARIHDNVVYQPAGEALTLLALGSVSILDNQFNSEMNDQAPQPLVSTKLAGTTLILNLGGFPNPVNYISRYSLLPSMLASLFQTTISLSGASGSLPLGGRSMANNANVANVVNVANAANLSRRNTAFDGASPAVAMSTFNRSSLHWPVGNILFTHNQIRMGAANQASYSLLITSNDDIAFLGNQLDCFGVSVIVDSILYGGTMRACENRFKEAAGQVSLLTLSRWMNTTTDNQGDHCVLAFNDNEAKAPTVVSGNQALSQTADTCKALIKVEGAQQVLEVLMGK